MKKKLFVKLITPMLFATAVIFAGCSNPNSSSGGDTQLFSADVSKGSVIKGIYSGDNEGTRIVFDLDGTVEFYDDGSASARAVTRSGDEGEPCARGTYVITADNIAKITIEEVLREWWGSISQSELEGKTLAVAFSGNDLSITIDKETLSFSTDKKDVYKPSSVPLFIKLRPINATYLFKYTLTLNGGNFSLTVNIAFDSTEWTVRGKYTQSGNTIVFTDPTLIGEEDATKATATVSGNTLTLIIEYAEENYTEKTVFKGSGSSWEHSEEIKLSSNGDITYSENGAICWKGTYTIIDVETASVNVKSGSIKDIFGTDQGNLYIEDASQEFLDLDLHDLDECGGIAISFARDK